jgi:hypothetical protein
MLGGLAPGDRPLGKWFAPSATVHQTALGREVPWRLPTEADDSIDVDVQDRMQLAAGPPLRVLALACFKFTASWRPNCYVERSDAEQAAWARRLEGEPRVLQRELASLVFHRLSPLHNRNLPTIERPAGAGRGWQIAASRKIRGLE